MYINDNVFEDECSKPKNSIQQSIYKVGLSKQSYHFFNEYKFVRNYEIKANNALMIIAVPDYSYRADLYPIVYKLFIAKSITGGESNEFYSIHLEDSWEYRDIPISSYVWAFVKDTALFPYQVYKLMFSWVH